MLLILCYHRVIETQQSHDQPYFVRGTAVTASVFEAHMRWLGAHYEFIDEEGVLAWLDGHQGSHKPLCWVTFDDGYLDNLRVAAPIAARYGARPTLFVTTSILKQGWSFPVDAWYATVNGATQRQGLLKGYGVPSWRFDLDTPETLARLIDGPEKRAFLNASSVEHQRECLSTLQRTLQAQPTPTPAYLSATQLCELEQLGWRIGPHSVTHRCLTQLSEEAQRIEVMDSISKLHDLSLRRPSSFFAYPDGDWNDRLSQRLEVWGRPLRGALTIDKAMATPTSRLFSLPRWMPSNDPEWFQAQGLTPSNSP